MVAVPDRRTVCAALLACSVAGCTNLVSPYSADLQHRASDMVAEVDGWERQMIHVAGTAKGDPNGPDVQATMAKWHGEAAAMAGIAAGLDPGTVDCSKTAGRARSLVGDLLSKAVAGRQQDGPSQAVAAAQAGRGCEAALVIGVDNDVTALELMLGDYCDLAKSTPKRCAAIFGGGQIARNGLAVADLVGDLQTIVYIETRKAPSPGGS